MCGIAGLRRFGDEPITEGQIHSLLLAIEHRGTHATGIAIMNQGELVFTKRDKPAWEFVQSGDFKDFLKANLLPTTDTVILHTRAATQGSPRKFENNHPLTVGVSAVVHNGHINNDDHLFKEMNLDRKAETDSDIIRAIVDANGIEKKTIRELNRMSGSAACAILHKDYPDKLMFLRSGSPLIYCVTDTGLLMWASTKSALHYAQRQWVERKGLWLQSNREDLKWGTMPDNTAYVFGPEGLEWHDKFETAYQYTAPRYRSYETYFDKMKLWDEEEETPTGGICPHCAGKYTIPKDLRHKPLWDLKCPNKRCAKFLAEEPKETKEDVLASMN